MASNNSNLARTFSYGANILLVLYMAFLLLFIGYGLDAHVMMGVGRIDPDESRRLLSIMADDGDDLQQRLAMSILINLRISIAAWWAIAFVSLYGMFVPFEKRAAVHLLGFFANADTGIVHLYHMGLFFGKHDPLVPTDDPYHRIPLPFDWPVALINLAAFFVVASSSGSSPLTNIREKTE
jgi:hypothetical protein